MQVLHEVLGRNGVKTPLCKREPFRQYLRTRSRKLHATPSGPSGDGKTKDDESWADGAFPTYLQSGVDNIEFCKSFARDIAEAEKKQSMKASQSIPVVESPQDVVWQAIRREAARDAAAEPLLSSFLYASILAHESFERAVAFVLANRLANATMLPTQLFEIFHDVLTEDDAVRLGALADVEANRERDPSCRAYSQALLYYKGFHAIQTHRIAHCLWNRGQHVLAVALQSRMSEVFAVDIHPAAKIGCGVLLDHGTGVVIGETAVIGNNCSLLQNVTLGGTGKEVGDRHPKISDNVLIGASATVLGNITIGKGAQIAAGSLVLKPVPPRTMVAGSPAKPVGKVSGNPALKMQQWSRKFKHMDEFCGPEDMPQPKHKTTQGRQQQQQQQQVEGLAAGQGDATRKEGGQQVASGEGGKGGESAEGVGASMRHEEEEEQHGDEVEGHGDDSDNVILVLAKSARAQQEEEGRRRAEAQLKGSGDSDIPSAREARSAEGAVPQASSNTGSSVGSASAPPITPSVGAGSQLTPSAGASKVPAASASTTSNSKAGPDSPPHVIPTVSVTVPSASPSPSSPPAGPPLSSSPPLTAPPPLYTNGRSVAAADAAAHKIPPIRPPPLVPVPSPTLPDSNKHQQPPTPATHTPDTHPAAHSSSAAAANMPRGSNTSTTSTGRAAGAPSTDSPGATGPAAAASGPPYQHSSAPPPTVQPSAGHSATTGALHDAQPLTATAAAEAAKGAAPPAAVRIVPAAPAAGSKPPSPPAAPEPLEPEYVI